MEKIKVPDANKNGKLDWFDVFAYFGTLGLNSAITLATIIALVKK